MPNVYGVLAMPVADLASKQAIKAAGCTHTVIQAPWNSFQPNGAGTALSASAVANIRTDFEQADAVGLDVMMEVALQYPPAWIASGVEQYKDQSGNLWAGGVDSGQQVRNWTHTALGRQYVADFIDKLRAAIGLAHGAPGLAIKTGGGYFGETHYPPAFSSGQSWWGFSDSMQTGVGLAGDEVVCPLPGYIPFGSGHTDANDSIWLNWYLNGLVSWAQAFIEIQREAGFYNADFHVTQPGYGVRDGFMHTQDGYLNSAAPGEDPRRVIAALANDRRQWPYSTWLNTADGFAGSALDQDKSAWKKVAETAQLRNKHWKLWGENTGGEDAAGLAAIFSGFQYGSALQGAAYAGSPTPTPKYNGLFWLDYGSLTDGNPAHAQLSDLAAAIAAAS